MLSLFRAGPPSRLGPSTSRWPSLMHTRAFKLASLVTLLLALLALLSTLHTHVLSKIHLHRNLTWYGLGFHGLAPSTTHESLGSTTHVPALEFPRWDARCTHAQHIFFGWRGHDVAEPAAVILDGATGELVWRWQSGSSTDQNDVRPQTYRGERFLTFQMDGEGGNLTEGAWYMLDEGYNVRYRVRPGNGLPHADMHEFQITEDDTALIITTVSTQVDLRSVGGAEDGWVGDCYFQELDIETGDVLFEWRSLDHFAPNTTMEVQNNCRIDPAARFAGCGDDAGSAFDYFHLNSVSKDARGNFLISARNIWGIAYIDGQTGEVLWTLGANATAISDFEDMSGGRATDFSWQHHARWAPGDDPFSSQRTLSFFDNHYHRRGDVPGLSGARVVELDLEARTASLKKLYTHPDKIKPESQGNAQMLENGNVLVGWGSSGAFTEFAADGEVLCDARFGAEAFFEFSPVSSYRVFRGEWTGMPAYPPSVAVVGNKAYVSWNGATEIERWQVEMYDPAAPGRNAQAKGGGLVVIAQELKTGFETVINLPKVAGKKMIRVVALVEGGEEVGATDFLDVPAWSVGGLAPLFVMGVSLVDLFLVAAAGAAIWSTCIRRRNEEKDGGRYQRLDLQEREVEVVQGGFKDEVEDGDVESMELQEGLKREEEHRRGSRGG